MYVDFKETIWCQVYVDDEYLESTLELLEEGDALCPSHIISYGEDPNSEVEYLMDSVTPMTPKENNGLSTIVAYNDENEEVFSNGK